MLPTVFACSLIQSKANTCSSPPVPQLHLRAQSHTYHDGITLSGFKDHHFCLAEIESDLTLFTEAC